MNNKPNILLITADQMRADAIGIVNNLVVTPNLDKIAKDGTQFTRAYCTSPVCTPSRASILTGRYPHCNGAWNIGLSVKEDEVTICDLLKKVGYRTVAVGKMHFRPQCKDNYTGEPEDIYYRDRARLSDNTFYGFDEHHISEDNKIGEYIEWLIQNAPQYVNNQELNDKSKPLANDCWDSSIPSEYHQSHWVASKAIEAIEKQDTSKPLFLWTSFTDPHHPFNPPQKYADMYKDKDVSHEVFRESEHDLRPEDIRHQGNNGYWPGGGEEHLKSHEQIEKIIRNYYAMITLIDDEIGRIINALKDKDMMRETIIIFTSDHGELLGDHKLLYKGPWMYEGLTRIPMIFYGVGVTQNKVTKALMENVDILPTLLELIGEQVPYGIQGKSQLKVIKNEIETERDSAVTSYDAHDRGIDIKCIRTDKYKLVVFENEKYGELYDYRKDPNELYNMFYEEEYKEVKATLYEKLCNRLIGDQDPLPQRKCLW